MPDFFTFGATLARMLLKRSPFDPKLMDRSRVRKEDFPPPQLPKDVSDHCRDFVRRLCAYREEKRLGYRGFWDEVRNHSFFVKAPDWDWKQIQDKSKKPPHTPSLKKLNFNPVYEAEEQIMAEGRKPLDKSEKEKVDKVFKNIGYNVKPPFRNSAGEIWPEYVESQSRAEGSKKDANAEDIQLSVSRHIKDFKEVIPDGVESSQRKGDDGADSSTFPGAGINAPSQLLSHQPSFAMSQIETKSGVMERGPSNPNLSTPTIDSPETQGNTENRTTRRRMWSAPNSNNNPSEEQNNDENDSKAVTGNEFITISTKRLEQSNEQKCLSDGVVTVPVASGNKSDKNHVKADGSQMSLRTTTKATCMANDVKDSVDPPTTTKTPGGVEGCQLPQNDSGVDCQETSAATTVATKSLRHDEATTAAGEGADIRTNDDMKKEVRQDGAAIVAQAVVET